MRFQIDSETADPLAVEMYEVKDTNRLVEEFMLFANIAVAKQICEFYPSLALLRCHPVPPANRFDQVVKVAASLGVTLNVDTGKALADSLDAAEVAGMPYFNNVLRIKITRCMSQARYFCAGERLPEEYRHYGLAANIYTHFTSPIRRYADVVVHRMLAAAIGIEPLPGAYSEKATISDVCVNINKRNYAAQLSGRESVAIFSRSFFKGEEVGVQKGVVMDCKAKGIVVLVRKYGVEGFVRLVGDDAPEEEGADASAASSRASAAAGDAAADGGGGGGWILDEENYTFRNSRTGAQLSIFQEVDVAISVEEREAYREELVLTLAAPNGHVACGGGGGGGGGRGGGGRGGGGGAAASAHDDNDDDDEATAAQQRQNKGSPAAPAKRRTEPQSTAGKKRNKQGK